jgi:hypothetical protein
MAEFMKQVLPRFRKPTNGNGTAGEDCETMEEDECLPIIGIVRSGPKGDEDDEWPPLPFTRDDEDDDGDDVVDIEDEEDAVEEVVEGGRGEGEDGTAT